MIKSLILYTVLIGVFGCLIGVVIESGQKLHPNCEVVIGLNKAVVKLNPTNTGSDEHLWKPFSNNIKSPLGLLLLQILVILIVSKLFGMVIAIIKQPSVIGEMIAGIFLGPSIMGAIFPGFSSFLFPKESLIHLQFLSQIGLMLFMFIIGMELDIKKLKSKAKSALVISHASIVFPYFLGVLIAYFLYEQFAPANIGFTAFALFMGIAISITAFPVLARILQERGLTKTSLGAIVITCAALDDVTAWCILAMVVAIAKAGTIASALLTILLSLVFIAFMFYVVSPWMHKKSSQYIDCATLSKPFVVVVFLVLLLSAFITEMIGIHALFGAFLAGVIMPQHLNVKALLMDKMEDISLLLLLPIFFAFTGLRTEIGLLNNVSLWGTCGLIVFIAVFGKMGGSAVAAKLTGYNWNDALSIGALMNTRGLMELIVLNIGYDLGILSPTLFAIMVLMAIITTFMTSPLLDMIDYWNRKKGEER